MSHGCPSPALLRELIEDTLAPGPEANLKAHLDACPGCQQKLAALAAGVDTWVATVGLAHPPPDPRSDPALRAVINELTGRSPGLRSGPRGPSPGREPAAGRPPTPGPGGSVALDFLAPSAEPGSLGRLDEYEILDVIGRGGMGVVLRARDTHLRRTVAVKVLAPHLADDPTARGWFLREARAAAGISHENVVTVHAVSRGDTVPYLVMQFVPSESLQDRLDRVGILPFADCVRVGLETAQGLAAAHRQGLVHRDVKPANILLEHGTGRVKLTDFGLAQAADGARLQDGPDSGSDSGVRTADEITLAGTPPYMSPEQATGWPVDVRSDLFSLGSVLFAMSTGRPPFRAGSTAEMLRKVAETAPPAVGDLNPSLPPWFGYLVTRLHARDPRDRYQTAEDVVRVLAAGRDADPRRGGGADSDVMVRLGPEDTFRDRPAQTRRGGRPPRRVWAGRAVLSAALFAVWVGWVWRDRLAAVSGRKAAAEQPAGAPAAPGPARERPAEVELLPLVDVRRDAVVGAWSQAEPGRGLVSPHLSGPPWFRSAGHARLQLPYRPPVEYDLVVRAERRTGAGPLSLGLVFGGARAVVLLDHMNGTWSGLDGVDGKDVAENDTRSGGDRLPAGREVTIECRVRRDRLTVLADATPVIDWAGTPARLETAAWARTPDGSGLYLGSASASFAFRSVVLRPLSGLGRPPADPADLGPDRAAAELLARQGWAVRLAGDGVSEGGSAADLPAGARCRLLGVTAGVDADVDRLLPLLPGPLTLDRLDLSHSAVTEAGLTGLTGLAGRITVEALAVDDTPLTDRSLDQLAGLPGLRRLRVGHGQFSQEALLGFATRRPDCRVEELSADQTAASMCLALGGALEIAGADGLPRAARKPSDLPDTFHVRVLNFPPMTPVRAWHHRTVRDLPELRLLLSWLNDLGDEAVREWDELPALEGLEIGTSAITADGVRWLRRFGGVRTFNLTWSRVDDAGLAVLAGFPLVEGVGLGSTRVTEAGLKALAGAGSLRRLTLAGVPVTDAAVEPLAEMKGLISLDIRGTRISPAAAARLRRALPRCDIQHSP